MLSPDRIVGVDEHLAAVATVAILEADADGIHVGCLRILRILNDPWTLKDQ